LKRILINRCVAAVEDDKFYGEYAEKAFRLFLDKRQKERERKSE
jgi:hypothetical protein